MPRHESYAAAPGAWAVSAAPVTPSGGTGPSHASRRGKVSLLEFMWHEHSLLGILAPDSHVPPPIKPCCCCCVFTDSLSRRHRLFIFVFVLALSTALAVQVSLGQHNSVYAIAVLIFIVTPCTCHLKSNLPTYSQWLMVRNLGPVVGVRFEEIALCAGIAYAVLRLWGSMHKEGLVVLWHALTVWGGTLVSELMCLPAKYCFGRSCCCCCDCCVPESYLLQHEEYISGDVEGHPAQKQPAPAVPAIARMDEPLLR